MKMMVKIMRPMFLSLAAGTAALALSAFATPASAGVLIRVDDKAQVMTVKVDGIETYRWKVSTGRSGYDTPTGVFHPFRTELDHYSKEWDDAPMPYSIFFTPEGHAIHGSGSVSLLGRKASHGCVRLEPKNAATLYDLVLAEGLENTEVVIVNGATDPALVASNGNLQAGDLY
jgi:lipoprotein-anchoring transpeptidase ErfK/SrfK